jgi:hypothetical protein
MSDKTTVEAFHAHLDKCAQCRHHPFDLCPIGGGLFSATRLLAAARLLQEYERRGWVDDEDD